MTFVVAVGDLQWRGGVRWRGCYVGVHRTGAAQEGHESIGVLVRVRGTVGVGIVSGSIRA